MSEYDVELVKAVMITAEVYSKAFSREAAHMYVDDLAGYPTPALMNALKLCRKELRYFPTVADVIARVDDGRPGPEEAFALLPKSEEASVVWTDEMAQAYGISRLIEDQIGARLAFKEKYVSLVGEARRAHRPIRWTPSLGHDKSDHAAVLKEAVDRGRLTARQAAALLPDGVAVQGKGLLMIGTDIPIEEPAADVAEKARALAKEILKDAPPLRQAREELRQRFNPIEHEERVLKQLEEMKHDERTAPAQD